MKILKFSLFFLIGSFVGGVFVKRASSPDVQEVDLSVSEARSREEKRSRPLLKEKANSLSFDLVGDFFSSLEGQDSGGFRKILDQLEFISPDERAIKVPLIFAAWAKVAPLEALQAAAFLKANKDDAVTVVLGVWAKENPSEAAIAYKKLERSLFTRNYDDSRDQVSGSQVLVRELLRERGDEAASNWAKTLNNIADKRVALISLFGHLASESPVRAVESLGNLNPIEQEYVIQVVAEQWGRLDPARAIEWANSLEGSSQKMVLPSLVRGIAQDDPKLASEYLGLIEENRDQEIGVILENWSESNFSEAGDWLLEGVNQNEQEDFVGHLVKRWAVEDPVQVRGWLQDQEAGIVRDRGIEAYVDNTVSGLGSPQELINWVSGIEMSSESRYRAINSALVAWSRTAPEEAGQFAISLELPNEVYAQYLFEVSAESPTD